MRTEATAQSARWLRMRFAEWLRTGGAIATLVDDLTIAVYEALANVVEHAYPPGHPDPAIRLHAQLDDNQVLVTVSDHGCWRTPNASGYCGRGLILMRRLTSEVRLNHTDHGTTVHLRITFRRREDGFAPEEPASAP
ncbi:MAG: ATP-binding protein [Pseudonocardiaceae bacterium]